MKKSLFTFLALFIIATFFTTKNYASVIIGSNVGVPTFEQAINQGLITLSGNSITQDVTIDGNVSATSNNLLFSNMNLNFINVEYDLQNNPTNGFFTLTSTYCHFNNCNIDGEGSFFVNESSFNLFNTQVSGDYQPNLPGYEGLQINVSENSIFELSSNSSLNVVRIDNSGDVIASQVFFTSVKLFSQGYDAYVELDHGVFENSRMIIHGGLYLGEYNNITFSNSAPPYFAYLNLDSEDGYHPNALEQNSVFERTVAGPLFEQVIDIQNAQSAYILNNDFIGFTNGFKLIAAKECLGNLQITDNEIIGAERKAIFVDNCANATISNNIISQVSAFPGYTTGGAIELVSIPESSITKNSISELSDVSGIRLLGCNEAIVLTNRKIKNGTNNIEVFDSYNTTLENNKPSWASKANIYVEKSHGSYLCSNLTRYGADGIKFSGISLAADLTDNHMQFGGRGLVYEHDVYAPPQFEKGNDYWDNVFGAEFEGGPDPLLAEFMRYTTNQNAPAGYELPTHTPIEWFNDSGIESAECHTYITGGNGGTEIEGDLPPKGPVTGGGGIIKEVIIRCTGGGGPSTGVDMVNIMQVLFELELNPDYLNDSDINNFYTLYENSVWDQLPLTNELVSVLENDIDNLSIESFTGTNGDLSKLDGIKETIELSNINAQLAYNTRVEKITQMKLLLNQINSNNTMINDYIAIANILLDHYLGTNISSTDAQWIQSMANDCVYNKGAAVYISRILCSANQWDYTKPSNCDRGSRNMRNIDTGLSHISVKSIYPNPATTTLHIDEIPVGTKVQIVDVFGKVASTVIVSYNKEINISNIGSGIYFINYLIGNKNQTFKFVKQ